MLFVAVLTAFCAGQARAQLVSNPPPLAPEWEAQVTPYLWLPWTGVSVRPADTKISSASGTIDPGRLVNHLSWVPFMGEIEFRNGPYGVLVDYLHAPVKTGISTRDILFGGATGGAIIDTGTALFLYRSLAQPDQYLDVGGGLRAWGLTGDIALNQRLLPAANVSDGLAWADPILAVRYHRDLGNGFGATASGDVGGFGIGAHIDWQAVGTIDYAVNSRLDLHAGFRSLNFNYGASRADFNVNMYGPIFSATFRF